MGKHGQQYHIWIYLFARASWGGALQIVHHPYFHHMYNPPHNSTPLHEITLYSLKCDDLKPYLWRCHRFVFSWIWDDSQTQVTHLMNCQPVITFCLFRCSTYCVFTPLHLIPFLTPRLPLSPFNYFAFPIIEKQKRKQKIWLLLCNAVQRCRRLSLLAPSLFNSVHVNVSFLQRSHTEYLESFRIRVNSPRRHRTWTRYTPRM